MFDDQQRKFGGQIPLGRQRPHESSALPAPVLAVRPAAQVQAASSLTAHTLRPVAVQRHTLAPTFQALSLQRETLEGLVLQRQAVRAQVQHLQASVPTGSLTGALQRFAIRQAPVAPLTQAPGNPSEWVQAARLEVQRVADPASPEQSRWLGGAERERHLGMLRGVGQGLAQGFRQDRGPALQRYADYGEALATLQRQALTGTIPRMVLAQVSPAERLPLQRAVDEALQRQAAQEAQDVAALDLQGLQRQLAELDTQAEQPVMERIQARRGSGDSLPVAVQRQLEAGLNHDLSGVRVHTDSEADLLSKKVNAVAFTTGRDIYFQSGRYDPNSQTGIELLAHEATHVRQQAGGGVGKGIDPDAGLEVEARQMGSKIAAAHGTSPRLAPTLAQHHGTRVSAAFTPTTTFQRRAAGSPTTPPPVLTVGKLGIVKQVDGANVHASPKAGSPLVQPQALPVGTRLGVISQTADGWSRVSLASGRTGYVQTLRVTTDLPDPSATLIRVTGGLTAIGVAERHYKALVRPGQDLRYYVNVLEYLDRQRGTGAFQGGKALKAGSVLWVPGGQMAQALVGQVNSGSITGGRWAEAKAAVGNGPGANILRSVLESPQYITEVLGETWKTVKEHWPVLLGTTVALVGAELLVGALAAAPEPTTITKFLAVGLQGLITAVAGAGLAVGVSQAARAGTRWLMQAWTAEGDAGKLKAASKAFLGMIGNLVLAVASVAGVRASAAKTGALAKMPTKMSNTPKGTLAAASQGQLTSAPKVAGAVGKVPKGPQNYIDNKYWKYLPERDIAERPAEIARLRAALPTLKGLTDSEIIAIRQYTTRAYVPLNGALRAGADPAKLRTTNTMLSNIFNMPPVKAVDADVYAQELTTALSKLPPYVGTVFRGEGTDRLAFFQALKPGDVWTEEAYFSTAFDPSGAMTHKDMVFRLTTNSGREISNISTYAKELEVLFTPGTKFRLVSIVYNQTTKKWNIVAEEL